MPRKQPKKPKKAVCFIPSNELFISTITEGILKLPESRQNLVAIYSGDARLLHELAGRTKFASVKDTIEQNPHYQVR